MRQHISLLALVLFCMVLVKPKLSDRTFINNSTSLNVKLSVQITTVLFEESQKPSPISQCANPIPVKWLPILKGTILIYFFLSVDHSYHSLWIAVKDGKDLLLKAY
jgi:hypothetical protein